MFTPILLEAHNPGPMTGLGNNTYLVAGSRGSAVLVDAGVGHADHLHDIDKALEAERARLWRVIVTHRHSDHASGAPAIAARHPDTTFAKYLCADEHAHGAVDWKHVGEGDSVEVDDGRLTILHTPGHSPDHIALWHEPSRSLFTGDLVTSGGSVMIQASRGGSLTFYLNSLRRLLTLEPRQLFPAHGPHVDDPKTLLTAYLDHRERREQQVVAALAAGHSSVEAIAECIYDQLGAELLAAARENVRAHLEKLRAEGRAIESHGRWTT